jgi:hypothetical protein
VFDCPDQLADIAQVLSLLRLGQLQWGSVHRLRPTRVVDDPLRVLRQAERTVPLTRWVERHIRTQLALAKTRVAKQVYVRIAPQQFDESMT